MSYKTYSEMVAEHITFLQSRGLNVEELEIDAGFIRCKDIESAKGRGERCYKTTSFEMSNGLLGLATWCRSAYGEDNFQTYGLHQSKGEQTLIVKKQKNNLLDISKIHNESARKAYGFWKHSQLEGFSDYLDRKFVGYHGIRFRNSDEYGNVAVVPMIDEHGRLWSYQLLNPDGTKRHPKDARTDGLFYCLAQIVNGRPLGIAESYVTAATCYELTGIPMVCAFSCHNLASVAKILRQKYSDSAIVLFADNDRHLPSNQGVLKGQEACDAIDGSKYLAIPDFGNDEPSKEATDWNDLFRLRGREFTIAQIKSIFIKQGNELRS